MTENCYLNRLNRNWIIHLLSSCVSRWCKRRYLLSSDHNYKMLPGLYITSVLTLSLKTGVACFMSHQVVPAGNKPSYRSWGLAVHRWILRQELQWLSQHLLTQVLGVKISSLIGFTLFLSASKSCVIVTFTVTWFWCLNQWKADIRIRQAVDQIIRNWLWTLSTGEM